MLELFCLGQGSMLLHCSLIESTKWVCTAAPKGDVCWHRLQYICCHRSGWGLEAGSVMFPTRRLAKLFQPIFKRRVRIPQDHLPFFSASQLHSVPVLTFFIIRMICFTHKNCCPLPSANFLLPGWTHTNNKEHQLRFHCLFLLEKYSPLFLDLTTTMTSEWFNSTRQKKKKKQMWGTIDH